MKSFASQSQALVLTPVIANQLTKLKSYRYVYRHGHPQSSDLDSDTLHCFLVHYLLTLEQHEDITTFSLFFLHIIKPKTITR